MNSKCEEILILGTNERICQTTKYKDQFFYDSREQGQRRFASDEKWLYFAYIAAKIIR